MVRMNVLECVYFIDIVIGKNWLVCSEGSVVSVSNRRNGIFFKIRVVIID